ncbi:MAG TPA: 2OG-Fe(II) oxygenase [Thermoanaerobaculia bacterium]|nr:2OG-Fe(II) oxygenase [Thermoanaerobaculia bacterium]
MRSEFLSDHPLPRFHVIPSFLDQRLVEDALAGCKRAKYETWCGYGEDADGTGVRSEFREPEQDGFYFTIHQRSRKPIPEVTRLRNLFSRSETIAALNDLTDAGISRLLEPDVLTYWNPGSFLERHTDDTPDTTLRLVMSVSLTDEWAPQFGGATIYAWRDLDRGVRLNPRLNTAVLFVPFAGSDHWVAQISAAAPPLTRFTWTAFFV